MTTFHPDTLEAFEGNLKRLREQLVGSRNRVDRCHRELTEAQNDHDEVLTRIADSEKLLAYMRFSNEQQGATGTESEA